MWQVRQGGATISLTNNKMNQFVVYQITSNKQLNPTPLIIQLHHYQMVISVNCYVDVVANICNIIDRELSG
jgi:hypothetical protein